jgi:hypothetical protein
MSAAGVIMIIFTVVLLAILGAEYLKRKRKQGSDAAADSGIQLEVVPQVGSQPPQ